MNLNSLRTNTTPPGRAGIAGVLLMLALVGILTGCLSRKALTRQTFALQSDQSTNSGASRGQAVLAIRKLEISPLFEGRPFVYRIGPDQYQVDPYAGFLVSPAHALATSLRSHLRNCGAFKNVVEPGSQLGADTDLEIYVNEMYGDFRQPDQPAAVLSMRMLFFNGGRARTNQPFLEKNYVCRVPLQQKSAAALVAGWNEALANTMARLVPDLASVQAAREDLHGGPVRGN